MTEWSRRKFHAGPSKSAQSHPPVLVKAGSDGLVNVVKATAKDETQTNQFDRTGNPSNKFIPPKRNETSPAFASTTAGRVTNGSSLNGGGISDRQNGVKKKPLLPPNHGSPNGTPNRPPNGPLNGPPNGPPHCQATKSSSSDSNQSNVLRSLANGDMYELDGKPRPSGECAIVTHVHVYMNYMYVL